MASIETLPAPDLAAPREEKWRSEQRAFHHLLPELLRTHGGEFVAIHEGQVVESGHDKPDVARRAYERFGYVPIFVSHVIAGHPEPVRVLRPAASTGRRHDRPGRGGQLMRVVGGSARGRALLVVPGEGTRPILDRVKTALFDILRPRIDGQAVLDLFAGSGGVGIEALSQGAGSCTFIELANKAIATIEKNLASTGFSEQAEIRHGDAFSYLRSTEKVFDLIYVAPPQYKGLWSKAVREIDARPTLLRAISPDSEDDWPPLVVVQIDPKEYEAIELVSLRETRQKRYGNTLIVFYEPAALASS